MTQPIHPMLERVARAIEKADVDSVGWEPHIYLPMARAAIQALLEPDEGQHAKGAEMMRAFAMMNPAHQVGASASLVYRAMLKPLLGDEK